MADAIRVLEAPTAADVPGVLNLAEAAVAEGNWVAGFVAFEAAVGLDPALSVSAVEGSGFEGLPAAWFGVFADRSATVESPRAPYFLGDWSASIDEQQHREGVDRIRELIRQGQTYQVNYTFGFSSPFSGSAQALYFDLIDSQACGYGGFIDTGRWQIVSASPELFFEWADDRIVCRPMKGTASRGLMASDDEAARLALLASEKDRAENVMIVDMVRNDLGRIAEVGSVETPALFSAEKYDTVWQLTSTVTCRTQPATSLLSVFEALFPSASITGAPKVATMEVIRELEEQPRGVYCGTIGFGGPGVSGSPEWAFNVAIRTVVVDEVGGVAHYGTGGGITIDSTAGGEYREALLKTQVLARRTADFRLLETMAWKPETGVWLLDRHLDRIIESAWYFDIPVDRAALEAAIVEVSAPLDEAAMIRLLLGRTGEATTEVVAMPLGGGKVRLTIDDRPLDRSDPLLYHKTTSRSVYEEALVRHPVADDVVLWNQLGEVTETTIGNLAMRIGGEWFTPPVSSGCLPGTYRAELIETGVVSERVVMLEDLRRRAEAVARFNSVRGWEEAELIE